MNSFIGSELVPGFQVDEFALHGLEVELEVLLEEASIGMEYGYS